MKSNKLESEQAEIAKKKKHFRRINTFELKDREFMEKFDL